VMGQRERVEDLDLLDGVAAGQVQADVASE
jgi:hypothetical protein